MSELDDKIREALSTQDAELFDDFSVEQGLFEMVGETFRGRHRWLVVLVMVYTMVFFGLIPLLVPVPFLLLGSIVVIVQTLVFCLLSIVYISMAVAHEEH